MKPKLTFLMPAHNEERIIGKALESLIKLQKDYVAIEVLIGLDGCTDRTREIVKAYTKKHPFFKYFELNERKGKQTVLEYLDPYIKGEIILIHDADWIYKYGGKEKLKAFVHLFDNPKIGGIANGFTADFFPEEIASITSLGLLASAWGNHFLVEYIKKKQTRRKEGNLLVDPEKMIFPFFLDVYRKSALDKTTSQKNLRAGDHIERTFRLLQAGYDILVPEDRELPRAEVTYRELSVKDFLKQRVRGIIAKHKIKSAYHMNLTFWNFHIPFLFYTAKQMLHLKRMKDRVALGLYWYGILYGIIVAKVKLSRELSINEVWNMRMRR